MKYIARKAWPNIVSSINITTLARARMRIEKRFISPRIWGNYPVRPAGSVGDGRPLRYAGRDTFYFFIGNRRFFISFFLDFNCTFQTPRNVPRVHSCTATLLIVYDCKIKYYEYCSREHEAHEGTLRDSPLCTVFGLGNI